MTKLNPILALLCLASTSALAADVPFPTFKAQQLDEKVAIGYGVLLIDINADHKPDIVVADSKRASSGLNPAWKMHAPRRPNDPGQRGHRAHRHATQRQDRPRPCRGLEGLRHQGHKYFPMARALCRRTAPWTLHPIPLDEVALHRVHVVTSTAGHASSFARSWAEAHPEGQLVRIHAQAARVCDPRGPDEGPLEAVRHHRCPPRHA